MNTSLFDTLLGCGNTNDFDKLIINALGISGLHNLMLVNTHYHSLIKKALPTPLMLEDINNINLEEKYIVIIDENTTLPIGAPQEQLLLRKAIKLGCISACNHIIQTMNVKPDYIGFLIACEHTSETMMRYVLTKNTIKTERNHDYALRMMCRNGNVKGVEMYCNMDAILPYYYTLYYGMTEACLYNQIDIVKFIISIEGFDIKKCANYFKRTFFDIKKYANYFKRTYFDIKKYDYNYDLPNFENPYCCAFDEGNLEIVQLLHKYLPTEYNKASCQSRLDPYSKAPERCIKWLLSMNLRLDISCINNIYYFVANHNAIDIKDMLMVHKYYPDHQSVGCMLSLACNNNNKEITLFFGEFASQQHIYDTICHFYSNHDTNYAEIKHLVCMISGYFQSEDALDAYEMAQTRNDIEMLTFLNKHMKYQKN